LHNFSKQDRAVNNHIHTCEDEVDYINSMAVLEQTCFERNCRKLLLFMIIFAHCIAINTENNRQNITYKYLAKLSNGTLASENTGNPRSLCKANMLVFLYTIFV